MYAGCDTHSKKKRETKEAHAIQVTSSTKVDVHQQAKNGQAMVQSHTEGEEINKAGQAEEEVAFLGCRPI